MNKKTKSLRKAIKDSLPNGPDGYRKPKSGTAFTEAVRKLMETMAEDRHKSEDFLKKLSVALRKQK